MNFISIENNNTLPLQQIPLVNYAIFYQEVSTLLNDPSCHCVAYYAFPENKEIVRFICCIADDVSHKILITSFSKKSDDKSPLESLTPVNTAMHVFEREIYEKFGVEFLNHPWLKPLRYPFDRYNKDSLMGNYPFFKMNSHELHEVGVGPIHAGIIEPGHFRFICNGEKVLHLEIALGYQHRGIEQMMLQQDKLLQQTILAESIVGDTVISHCTAFAQVMEALKGIEISENAQLSRTIAAEMERIAIHTSDLSALCTDVAFQLGSSVLQGLRTIIINTFLIWCGNRFGRKLIRCGKEPYPLNPELIAKINKNLDNFEKRYIEVADKMFDMPSVLARFERIGIVTTQQSRMTGVVGMAARSAGINRDIRSSHLYAWYPNINHRPILLEGGDVKARAKLRDLEICQSLNYIRQMLARYKSNACQATGFSANKNASESFAISLTEGWRGEICHCAVTNADGSLKNYKVKDASVQNWVALALAVRDNDISDFPVCNKSFNLSYCGNDL